jgi:hypothetical protein
MKVKSSNNICKWQMGFNSAFKGLMYVCCALVGAIKDSVSQNARHKSKKKVKIR